MKKIASGFLLAGLWLTSCTKNNELKSSSPLSGLESAGASSSTAVTQASYPYGAEIWISLGAAIPAGWVSIRSSGTQLLIRKV